MNISWTPQLLLTFVIVAFAFEVLPIKSLPMPMS